MEEPCLTCSVSRSKIRRSDMSVDTVKAMLAMATSMQQTLPSLKPDIAAQNPMAIIEACGIKTTRAEARSDPAARGAVGW